MLVRLMDYDSRGHHQRAVAKRGLLGTQPAIAQPAIADMSTSEIEAAPLPKKLKKKKPVAADAAEPAVEKVEKVKKRKKRAAEDAAGSSPADEPIKKQGAQDPAAEPVKKAKKKKPTQPTDAADEVLESVFAGEQPTKDEAPAKKKKRKAVPTAAVTSAAEEAPPADDATDTTADTTVDAEAYPMSSYEPKKKKRRGGGNGSGGGNVKISRTLFLGQLPYSATVADIEKHFKAVASEGPPVVRLLTTVDGKPRGMAFLELASESDLHSALKLHHSQLGGRRINVERTVGGGGTGEQRRQKLKDLRDRQGKQSLEAMRELVKQVLPVAGAAGGGGGGGEEEGEDDDAGSSTSGFGATREDVDEKLLEFLAGVAPAVAESVLREVKAISFDGVRNRAAYLMGVCRRKVEDSDTNKQLRKEVDSGSASGGGAAEGGGGGGRGGKGKGKGGKGGSGRGGGGKGRGGGGGSWSGTRVQWAYDDAGERSGPKVYKGF